MRWAIEQLNPAMREQVQRKLDELRARSTDKNHIVPGPEKRPLAGATSSKTGPRKKGSHALIPKLSTPEERLAFHLRAVDLGYFEREYTFWPDRKFRADFAFVAERLLIEVDGGLYTEGRHTRAKGYEKDCVKINEAQILGWQVLRFSPAMVASGHAVHTIKRALEALKKRGGKGESNEREQKDVAGRAGRRDAQSAGEEAIQQARVESTAVETCG